MTGTEILLTGTELARGNWSERKGRNWTALLKTEESDENAAPDNGHN